MGIERQQLNDRLEVKVCAQTMGNKSVAVDYVWFCPFTGRFLYPKYLLSSMDTNYYSQHQRFSISKKQCASSSGTNGNVSVWRRITPRVGTERERQTDRDREKDTQRERE